jgi:hypothetical protein
VARTFHRSSSFWVVATPSALASTRPWPNEGALQFSLWYDTQRSGVIRSEIAFAPPCPRESDQPSAAA